MKKLKFLIDMHSFFIKESPQYMKGAKTLKGYYLYYPIAYYKFMRDSILWEIRKR